MLDRNDAVVHWSRPAVRGAPVSAAGFAQAGKIERSRVVKRIREKLIELDGGPGTCEPA